MIDLDITFFIQFVNFCITLVVLNVVLIRPVREIIKKRNDRMASYMEDAEKFNNSAEEKLENYSAALNEARAKGTQERNKYREEGQAEEKEIISEVSSEVSEKLAEERKAIESEVQSTMDSLKNKVDDLSGRMVEKVLA
jgi:F-type H+-transporting ATPase subunit b